MVCDSALLSLENRKHPINLKFKMDNSSPNDFEKGKRNNWLLPGKSKSFPRNRPGNSRNN